MFRRSKYVYAITLMAMLQLWVEKDFAQSGPAGKTITFQPVYGSHLIPETDPVKDRLYGIDVTYLKDIHLKPDGWVSRSNAKSFGLNFFFRDMNKFNGYGDTSANSFGKAYGLVGTMQFELLKFKKASLLLSPGMGVGYVSKTFFTNPYNRFIGSHINMVFKYDVGVEVPVSPSVKFLAGTGFLHLSNASFQLPNGGLNTVNIYAGLRIGQIPEKAGQPEDTYAPLKRNSWELAAGFGRRGVYEKHSGNYRSGLYAGYNYWLNDLVTLKGGIDAIYYFTRFDPNRFWDTYQNYATSYDPWRVGASVGADVNLWRVVINGQVGKYLYFDRYFKNINWYWSFGPAYFVTPRLGFQARVYMNLDQADYINWGTVFRF